MLGSGMVEKKCQTFPQCSLLSWCHYVSGHRGNTHVPLSLPRCTYFCAVTSRSGCLHVLSKGKRILYRSIRLEQKRGVFQPFCTLSYYRWHQASLFLLVLSVFYVYCVVAVCVRDCFVHVQAESRYLCVSVWLCWYTVVFVTPWPSFYKRRQRSRAGLHQLHV